MAMNISVMKIFIWKIYIWGFISIIGRASAVFFRKKFSRRSKPKTEKLTKKLSSRQTLNEFFFYQAASDQISWYSKKNVRNLFAIKNYFPLSFRVDKCNRFTDRKLAKKKFLRFFFTHSKYEIKSIIFKFMQHAENESVK